MQTLAERIARDGPVNELDAVGWAIRLAKRLEALHALGVFHGSVSPACVVTEGAERASRGRLADVRTTSSNLAFQSPERVLGGDLSAADDAWAVAAVMYTLLTGSPPFGTSDEADLKQKILAAQPAPLAVFDVGDDDLQHVIDSAFAREIGERTTIVLALRKKLEEWHPDPKVRHLPALEDDEEVSTSDDDERTMLRPAPSFGSPVFPPPGGSSPRRMPPAAGSSPQRMPPAAGSSPQRMPPPPAAGSSRGVPPPTGSSPRGVPPPAGSTPRSPAAGPKPPPMPGEVGSGPGGPQAASLVATIVEPPTPRASAPLDALAASAEPDSPTFGASTGPGSSPFGPAPGPSPAVAAAFTSPDRAFAPPAAVVPDPSTVDDEDEAKTVMREFGGNIAEAARAAIAGFAPRAIGGAAHPQPGPAAPRPAAGRPAEQTTGPMAAMFSPPTPVAGPPPHIEDEDSSDLQATVMREAPPLPPEVASRLDQALGNTPNRRSPLWQTAPLLPGGPPGSAHGQPHPGLPPGHGGFSPHDMDVSGRHMVPVDPLSRQHPAPPPSPYGPPQQHAPPPMTQAMDAWNSGQTAPLQPVPPLPGVNAPLGPGQSHPNIPLGSTGPMPVASGFAPPSSGFMPPSSGFAPDPSSRPGFPSPMGSGTQLMQPQAWGPPQAPGAPSFDTGSLSEDPFRPRGRGVTVAAIFALVLAAAVTFYVVRYLF